MDNHGAFERMVAWGQLGSSSGGAGYGGALGVDAPAVSSDSAEAEAAADSAEAAEAAVQSSSCRVLGLLRASER